MSVDRYEQALARFDQLAPRARNLADSGDPSRLERLVDDVLAGERSLADDGALRELGSIAPGVADRFASYLAFPFGREARIRAAFASTELIAGKARWTPAQALARLRMGEEAERAAALSAVAGIEETVGALEEIAPARVAKARPAKAAEPAKAGSILLPTPELMAELGLVAPSPPAPVVEAGPDRSRELGELVLALVESVGGRAPKEYGELRAAARSVADFRVRHPMLSGRGSLVFDQPAVPFGRAGARAIEMGDVWSSLGALLGSEGWGCGALAFAATTLAFSGYLADAGSDRRRTARAVGAAIGAVALECHLVGLASGLEDFSDRERDALGFSRPRLLARLLWAGACFEGAPGEDTARYAGGRRLEDALFMGAALAFDLRERFDEDWFRNPRVTDEVVDDSARTMSGSIDQVIEWLKESLRL